MHSPVFINYDPALETNDLWTDWEDYSDDFYDSDEPKAKRRKVEKPDDGQKVASTRIKRRKLKSLRDLPDLSLGEPLSPGEDDHRRAQPTVLWKSRGYSPRLPVVRGGEEEKVSILTDWKDRLKPPLPMNNIQNSPTKGRQRVIAVVVQQPNPDNVSIDGEENTSISSSTRKRPRKAPQPDHLESSASEGQETHAKKGRPRKKSKREMPQSSELALELFPVNGASSTKRKRQSDENDNVHSTKRTTSRRRNENAFEATNSISGQALDEDSDQGSVDKATHFTQGNGGDPDLRTLTGHKGRRSATKDDPVSKPGTKSAKGKQPAQDARKENVRPKVVPAGRRSTRRT